MRCDIKAMKLLQALSLVIAAWEPTFAAKPPPDASQEILRELRRIESATNAAIGYREYSAQVADVKARIDAHVTTRGDSLSPDFRSHVATAMCLYAEGARSWTARIAQSRDSVPTTSCIRGCSGSGVQEALKKEKSGESLLYMAVGYRLLADVWNCARVETELATSEKSHAQTVAIAKTAPPVLSKQAKSESLSTSDAAGPARIERSSADSPGIRFSAERFAACFSVKSEQSSSGFYDLVTLTNKCDESLDVYLAGDEGHGRQYTFCCSTKRGTCNCSRPVSILWSDPRACPSSGAVFDGESGACDDAFVQ